MAHKLNIYGVIGSEWGGITAKQVVEQLKAIAQSDDRDIELRINSGGGYVDEAVAMVNRIRDFAKEHDAEVTAKVDGLAASAATLVMLAADRIVIPDNATVMVHQPWGVAAGTAEDMRKGADLLDMTEDSMVAMYARRTGLDVAKVRDLLAAETWMGAVEAVALGFGDEVEAGDDAIEAQARIAANAYLALATESNNLKTYTNAPLWARVTGGDSRSPVRAAANAESTPAAEPQSTQEAQVATSTEEKDKMADKTITAPGADSDIQAKIEAAKAEARKEEQVRSAAVREACTRHGRSQAFTDALVAKGLTVEQSKLAILDDLAATPVASVSGIRLEVDEADKRVKAATRALELRANLLDSKEARQEVGANEMVGMSLFEMASLFAGDADPRIGGRKERLGAILASANRVSDYWGANGRPAADIGITHTTSDFTNILANVANKAMLLGWDQTPVTHEPWTNRGTLPDFKQAKRVGLNLFPSLELVEEGAEFTGATVSDRGNNIQLATYGKTFAITRQALINDDLMAMMRMPRAMGAAARRTVTETVYGVLTANAALADGFNLFSNDHSNTNSINIDAAGLATLKEKMRTQTDPGTSKVLNILPRYLVVPAALEYTAQVLLNAGFISDGTTTISNVISGLELIVEPRLDASSGTTIYLMADGSQYDTIEVAYLDGNDMPRLEQMQGWRVDGTEFKVGIDFGVAVRDFRGMQQGT